MECEFEWDQLCISEESMWNHIIFYEEIEIIYSYIKIDTQKVPNELKNERKIFVPREKESYLVFGKLGPVDLYSSACHSSTNTSPIRSNPR